MMVKFRAKQYKKKSRQINIKTFIALANLIERMQELHENTKIA